MRRIPHQRGLACLVLGTVLALSATAASAEAPTVEQLQQEMKAMRAQFEQMQEKLKQQDELIQKLSKEKSASAPVTPAPMAAAAVAPTNEEQLKQDVKADVMREIQPSLTAANKTFPSQFNPAIGLIIDTIGSYQEIGGGNFDFRSAELGVAASIDPFARGYAIINGNGDGVEVEEAAIVTTSLPYNLTLKGGRFFADFGRLAKFHDHELPFVDRPIVLDKYVGGESQADGLELDYLTPLDQYVTFTLGAYNKIGAENFRVKNFDPRPLDQFTYLFRPSTFININDNNSADVGISWAYTPKLNSYNVDGTEFLTDGKARQLVDLDLTYRYIPLAEASYRSFVWGTEFLYNRESFNVGSDSDPVFSGENAFGLYSYAEPRITRRLYPGFLFQWVQPINGRGGDTLAYSPYLTLWASEFQRLRAQYQYLSAPGAHESQFFLQWTAIIGSHVHGFRDR
jgi:hypothetical protein